MYYINICSVGAVAAAAAAVGNAFKEIKFMLGSFTTRMFKLKTTTKSANKKEKSQSDFWLWKQFTATD